MALDNFSRFKDTPLIIEKGVETYGVWKGFPFTKQRPADEFIGIYQVTSQTEGRPDLIANAVYGTPYLDWVLIMFNNISEVFGWPRAGMAIEYPLETIVLPNLF